MDVNHYWTVVAGIAGFIGAAIVFWRDRNAQSFARTNEVVNRLIAADKILIDAPEVQQYLSQHAVQSEDYFRDAERLEELLFFKTKTLVYTFLNIFDDILAVATETSFIHKPILELDAWREYIIVKVRHPLYRSILHHEQGIFGESLAKFWRENHNKIAISADPFVW